MLQLYVCQVIEHLVSLESTQVARVALSELLISFSCSPNFPRIQNIDIRILTHDC